MTTHPHDPTSDASREADVRSEPQRNADEDDVLRDAKPRAEQNDPNPLTTDAPQKLADEGLEGTSADVTR